MSIFLIIVLILLLAGAIVTYLLSGRQGKEATTGAIVVLAITLIVWILANRFLPLSFVLADWSPMGSTSQWLLLVDNINWQISFYFLLFFEALLLTQSRFNLPHTTAAQSFGERLFLPLTLVLTAIVLLAIWSSSLPGLISSWTLLAIFWLILLWVNQGAQTSPRELIKRFGLLLLSVAFLGFAVATSDRSTGLALTGESWPTTSLFFAFLAVLTQLGAIPLHWWRPLTLPLRPSIAVIIHLLPSVAGAALLARLVLIEGGLTTIAPLITVLGWLGLFFGAYLAWIQFQRPVVAVTGLAVAQVGLITINGGWIGSHSVVASYRVLILAVGSLYLVNGLPKQRFPYYVVVPTAALAGLPLTAGFSGLAPLYSDWFSSGLLGLAIVTGLLIIPVIAAAIQVSRQATNDAQEETLSVSESLQINMGLLLPTLGLLVLPGSDLVDIPLVTWLYVLVIIVASIILNRYVEQIRVRLLNFNSELNTVQIELKVQTIIAKLANGLSVAIRETAGILEGERGMLWLLILMIVIWFAQSG